MIPESLANLKENCVQKLTLVDRSNFDRSAQIRLAIELGLLLRRRFRRDDLPVAAALRDRRSGLKQDPARCDGRSSGFDCGAHVSLRGLPQ